MAPRTTPIQGPLKLSLLLLVSSSWLLDLPGCGATLYTCVIYGNNVPSSAQDLIDVDASSLLRKLKDYEGEGFVAVEAGASDRRLRGRGRDLGTGEAMKQEEDEEAEDEEEASRRLIDCPNSCSHSGSNYCRALGCAYCGTCNRRDRHLQTFSLLRGRRDRRGLASARTVEGAMNRELAGYCEGITGCSLWSKIFVVNEDGSLSPAW